jgi:hypothetical protein
MESNREHSGASEESDQLPEEAPPEVVEDDAGGQGDARDQAEDSAGSGEANQEQATGNSPDSN